MAKKRKAAADLGSITIEDIGPIERLEIPIPDGGGIIVLRGRNGSGKSTALRAAEGLLGKSAVGVTARDNTRRGRVEGWGAKLSVTRSTRRSGSLTVEEIDGRADLGKLVDPGIKDPDAADAARIRALLSLAALEIKPEEILASVGIEELEIDAEGIEDPVTLGAKIKRTIEAEARVVEKGTDTFRGKYESIKAQADEIPDCELSAEAAHDAYTEAIRRHDKLQDRQELASRIQANVDEAKAEIESINEDFGDPDEIQVAIDDWQRQIDKWQLRIADAQKHVNELGGRLKAAKDAAKRRKQLTDLMLRLGEIGTVTDDEIEDARQYAKDTAEQLEHARNARRKHALVQECETIAVAIRSADQRAKKFRDAAAKVEQVLAERVSTIGIPVRLVSGSLCVEHPDRGWIRYADLSHGERWKCAIDWGLAVSGQTSVLVIPQESWDGLDPENRAIVADHARKQKALLITAEAAEGPLTVANFGDGVGL